MVSNKLKTKWAIGKAGKAAGMILPLFKKDRPEEFVDEMIREDEDLRGYVMANPHYRVMLEKNVNNAFKKYKGVLKGGRLVDSWDRVTSAIGEIGDIAGLFSAGAGNLASLGEEGVEMIPKVIYGAYYVAKTGDWKAIPYWALFEAASCIPYVGDAIDWTNIYINRARKFTKKKAKQDFLKDVKKGGLEQRMAA